ncbi:hypothetical protein BGX21_000584 [Mortierella sp. AD011]|nr:hypothetical protein BGX21_000584 [Mortierella sp. AD011]
MITRSNEWKWSSRSLIKEIKSNLRQLFTFLKKDKDAFETALKSRLLNVCRCKTEADLCVGTECTANADCYVVSGDSDLVYQNVEKVLRPIPKRHHEFALYEKEDILDALDLPSAIHLLLCGIISDNDYSKNRWRHFVINFIHLLHETHYFTMPVYKYDVTMTCTGCSGAVTRVLSKLEGVNKFDVSLENQKVTVESETLSEDAVKAFAEWTQQQVKAREEFNKRVYGSKKEEGDEKVTEDKIPPVYVVFLGHSMGGLVAADTALLLNDLPQKSPVIGILAFDTPYYGLNHTIFTQAAYERATGFAQKATGAYSLVSAYVPATAAWSALSPSSVETSGDKGKDRDMQTSASAASSGFSPSSLWSATSSKTVEKEKVVATKSSSSSSKWGWGSIALGVGAAVVATGAAVVVNRHLNKGMEYVTSHMQFVGILWNNAQLRRRVANTLELPIGFHCFYTQVQIPASSSNNWKSTSRTFVELTSIPDDIRSKHFSIRECSGQDEIEAHMEMFNPGKNFDYYQMGDDSLNRVKTMVEETLKREQFK